MKEIAKTYDHNQVEADLYKMWEGSGYFKPEVNGPGGEPFCIIMPPPNSNGSLHLGHAVFITLEDLMTRFARMQGKAALWLPGADHAGFETQTVFEKKLEKEGKSRFDMSREDLYKATLEFTLKNKEVMESQLKRLGASCDWDREKFTLDPDIVKIVYQTFVDLYNDGLAYRASRPVNWCTRHQTSLSDLEVKFEEQVDPLYYIKYGPLVLATVRPETKFGDTAVAVNPNDKRYKEYVGKEIEIETVLGPAKIKVIADEYVDPKFGTGVVKITPAHDPNDFEVAKRHNLEIKEVIDKYGKLNEKAGPYQGMKIKDARAKVVEDMQEKGLIEKIDENYVHSVGKCYKCGSVIEPRVLPQWFIAVNKEGEKSGKNLAKDALKAVGDGKTKFVTEKFEKIYRHWMTNIRDWNISRQIVWGIQLPVYYRKSSDVRRQSGNDSFQSTNDQQPTTDDVYVGIEPPKDLENWERDPDVFDTWFSSGQWPFATLLAQSGKSEAESRKSKVMGFAGDIVAQIFDSKTKTYRTRDHGFKTGENVLFENSATGEIFGSAVISDVKETTVGEIDLQDKAHWKTYEKREDLINAFKRHHPELDINESTPVWIYTYKFEKSTNDQRPTTDFSRFYPTTVMETGWDILFFWVARMMMLGLYVTGEVPFKNVYLHGLVRDKDRQKMSKSKGNVIDPLGVADLYGSDAVRMALVFGTSAGSDAVISEEKIKGMRNFSNKIWNASRFTILRITGGDVQTGEIGEDTITDLNINDSILTDADKEILKKHAEIVKSVTKNIEKYNFSFAAEEIYAYFWHDFCDVYIEATKGQLEGQRDGGTEGQSNTKRILIKILSESLQMLHPFMPYVTEAVWQELRKISPELKDSIMISKWPTQ